jgi:hypothetical protein
VRQSYRYLATLDEESGMVNLTVGEKVEEEALRHGLKLRTGPQRVPLLQFSGVAFCRKIDFVVENFHQAIVP